MHIRLVIAGSIPAESGGILLWRLIMKHFLFSTVIIPLSLVQKGQLLVSGETMCTSTGIPLRGLSLSSKSVVK